MSRAACVEAMSYNEVAAKQVLGKSRNSAAGLRVHAVLMSQHSNSRDGMWSKRTLIYKTSTQKSTGGEEHSSRLAISGRMRTLLADGALATGWILLETSNRRHGNKYCREPVNLNTTNREHGQSRLQKTLPTGLKPARNHRECMGSSCLCRGHPGNGVHLHALAAAQRDGCHL